MSEHVEGIVITERLQGRRARFARAALRGMMWRLNPYQPVLIDGRVAAEGQRGCEERAAQILEVARAVDAQTVVDLGCAEGYFVRRCAEEGRLAIGIDGDARRLSVAQWSLTLDGVEGFGFIKSRIDLDTLPRFPVADLTVFLSVLHHVMYTHGLDHAQMMLEAIRARTRKAMVFEMGQSDETEFAWASRLPDMGQAPHEWIRDLLISSGFVDVEKLGEVRSFNSAVRRAVFVARVAA